MRDGPLPAPAQSASASAMLLLRSQRRRCACVTAEAQAGLLRLLYRTDAMVSNQLEAFGRTERSDISGSDVASFVATSAVVTVQDGEEGEAAGGNHLVLGEEVLAHKSTAGRLYDMIDSFSTAAASAAAYGASPPQHAGLGRVDWESHVGRADDKSLGQMPGHVLYVRDRDEDVRGRSWSWQESREIQIKVSYLPPDRC